MNLRGLRAERRACRYLRRCGLTLVARNYTCRAGEIDLVMEDGDTVVFVEVRERTSARYGTAAASITPSKQKKIERAARHFLQSNAALSDRLCRFDVIAIDGTRISWLQSAFEC